MKIKDHTAEYKVIIVSIILGVIPLVWESIGNKTSYTVWSVGIIVVTAVITLRIELKGHFEQFNEIYMSLATVNDSDLFSIGKEAIRDCKEKIQQLSRGEIYGHVEAMRFATERLEKAKNSVVATHIVKDMNSLRCWSRPEFINWVKRNKDNQVSFIRYFLLDPHVFKQEVDCEHLISILKEQEDMGIDVKIIEWDEDLQKDYDREFILYDSNSVIVFGFAPCGKYERVNIKKNFDDINKYKARIKKLDIRKEDLYEFIEKSLERFCKYAEDKNDQQPLSGSFIKSQDKSPCKGFSNN
ncbi:hypothetical protein GKODMF_09720 [Candidatus Electrothrix gigas]